MDSRGWQELRTKCRFPPGAAHINHELLLVYISKKRSPLLALGLLTACAASRVKNQTAAVLKNALRGGLIL